MPEYLYKVQIALTIAAIFLGPVTAVCITLWWQNRRDKKAARRDLFLTLMGERRALEISYQVAKALNVIDVAFAGCTPVVQAWHKYYAVLNQRAPPAQERVHAWLELLSAMASELRYPIQQTDLDKFYLPQGHAEDIEFQREVGQEWLRVLKSTKSLGVELKDEHKPGGKET